MQRGVWIAWKLVCMVAMLDLVTYLNHTPIFECMWLDVNPRIDLKEDTCFNENTCSKYVKHSRFNSQHTWEDLYDHLMSMKSLV